MTSWLPVRVTHAPETEAFARRKLLLGCCACLTLAAAAACKGSGPSSCNDTSALPPDAVNARTALGYSDTSTEPGQVCLKCLQFVPAPSADQCAGCKVLKGPIHPNGYCRAFIAS